MSSKKNTGLIRRTSGLMALEQRFMFDGAAVADATQTVASTDAVVAKDVQANVAAALAKAEQQAQQKVAEFLNKATDQEVFNLFSGGKQSPDAAWTEHLAALRESLNSGNTGIQVVMMEQASQFTAIAAFAANGPDGKPTIFVNPYWAGLLGSEDLNSVLVEEIGHWMDSVLNPDADTQGDEGQNLADAVMGKEAQVSRDSSATDSGWVTVAGANYQVEFASFNFTNAYEMVYDQNNDTIIDTNERWADKEQNLHYFNASAPLGAVRIDDGTNGQNFSGNDVSATSIVINGSTYYGWISRPIKANGLVRGFYFWTDADFTSFSIAQSDGNQDGDSNIRDNRGFLLVVDQSWFDSQITATGTTKTINNVKDGNDGTITVANVGSSSDRVDSALNSLLPTAQPPEAIADASTATVNVSGGSALEAGGLSNATTGYPAWGNVLTNDVPTSGSTTKSVISAGIPAAAATTVTATGDATSSNGTSIVGTYGTLRISQNGSYYYVVTDENNAAVQALRTTSNTLTDVFTYTMTDSASGGTSTTTISITIRGANDTPVAVNDYNTAKESLTSELAPGGTNYGTGDTLGRTAVGNVLPNDTDVDSGDSKSLVEAYLTGAAVVNNPPSSVDLIFTVGTTFSPVGAGDEVWLWVDDDSDGNKDNGEWKAVASDALGVNRITATGPFDGSTLIIPLSDTPSYYWNGSAWTAITDINGRTFGFKNNDDAAVKTETSASMKAGTASSAQVAASSTITISGTAGSILAGMTVSGDGVAGLVTVDSVTYDPSGNATTVTLSSAITSINGTSLTFTETTGGGMTLVGRYGTLVFNANGLGGYTYTPFADNSQLSDGQSGIDAFKYTMQDTGGLQSTATLYITVLGSGLNDPIAIDDNPTGAPGTDGGAALEKGGTGNATPGFDAFGNVLTNDTTTAGTNVIVSATTNGIFIAPINDVITLTGTYGTLRLFTVDGTYDSVSRIAGDYVYEVNNANATVQALQVGQTLTDSFRYRIENGETSSESGSLLNLFDIAALTITINGANDAPIAADDGATAIEAGGVDNTTAGYNPTGNVLYNDSDVDHTSAQLSVASVRTGNTENSGTAGTLSGSTITLVGTYGTLTMNTDGSWTYTVDNNNPTVNALAAGASLTEYFNYTVEDAGSPALVDHAVLSIVIDGAADSVSVNDLVVNEGSPYAVFTVLGGYGVPVTLDLTNGTSTPTTGIDNTGLQYWDESTSQWTDYNGGSITIGPSNQLLVRTPFSAEKEDLYDPNETFKLTVTPTGGSAVAGTATIKDDGTGTYYSDSDPLPNGNPTVDPTQTLDDDRPITVTGGSYNEASPRAVFTVNANPGQVLTLDVLNAAQPGKAPTGDNEGKPSDSLDNAPMYYSLDGGATWQLYTGPITAGNVPILVAVDIENERDDVYEGEEQLKLVVTSPTQSASGYASIFDDGTGTVTKEITDQTSNDTGANDPSVVKDDDRPITVTGGNYNEASPRAVFTVNANPGQVLTLDVLNAAQPGKAPTGDNEGKPNDSLDTAPIYYSLDGGATWQLYTGPITAGNVPILVAVDITNESDDVYEGEEQLKLVVTSPTQSASGYASIFDDGTGTVTKEITDQTRNDTGANDPAVVKDDDRRVATPPPPPAPAPIAPPVPPADLTPPPPKAAPQAFSSTLTPLAPSLVPVDPPMVLREVVTSGSGFQIPVSEAARPGLSLYQGITDQFIQRTEATTKISLPFDAFIHSNKDAVIKLDAKQADGSRLPAWVQFDPATGVFEVTPPKGFKGKLDLKVIARDDDGREAVAIFQMFIGEQQVNRPQSRDSFSDKLRMAGKRPVTLVRVADAGHKVVVREAMPARARAG